VVVRQSVSGDRLGLARIDNDPVALSLEIAKAGPDPDVVLEATYGWYWAADVLEAAGARVHLAHPLGVKGFAYRRVKNDARDAADLCDLLRMGRLPEAYLAPPPVRHLRETVRHRAKLVALRSGLKAQVHAVLAKQGVQVGVSDLFGVAGKALLAGAALDPPYRARVDALLRLIDAYDFEIDVVSGRLRAQLARHQGYHAVQAVPGVGPTLAAVFVAEIGPVDRFPTARHLVAWAGLTPRHRESDTVIRAARSPSRAHGGCGGRPSRRCRSSRPPPGGWSAIGPGSANTVAGISPPSRWPASCSRWSTTACATGTSAPSLRPTRREPAGHDRVRDRSPGLTPTAARSRL
jgi:transposase